MDYSMLFNFAGNLHKKPSKFLRKSIALLAITFVFLSVNNLNAQAPNDDCASPTPLAVTIGSCVNTLTTNVDATISGNAHGCAGSTYEDVWYSFVAPPSGEVIIETSTGGSFTDSGMALYSSCIATSPISCSDDEGPGLFSRIEASGLTPGDTYFIAVWEFNGGGFGDFNICIEGVENSPPPVNEVCSGAVAIACGTPIQASNAGALADTEAPCGGVSNSSSGGLWYSFTAPNDGDYRVTTCSALTDFDTKVRIFSGPCNALVCAGGDDDESADPLCTHSFVHSMAFVTLTAGEDYFILVQGFGSAEGDFELLVVCPPVVLGCTDITACNFDSLANQDDDSCFVEGDSCDDGDTGTTNDVVDAACDCTGTIPPVPANEECVDAIAIDCDSPILGYTIGASNNGIPTCVTSSGSGGEVWYSFTAPIDGDYKITTCSAATDYDTKVRVFSGGCGVLDCVGGDDDESADPLCTHTITVGSFEFQRHSMVFATLTAGEEYLILVHGFLGNEGTFELLVVCPPIVPGCTDVAACNFDSLANQDDLSCIHEGDTCDDGDAGTSNDMYNATCTCVGTPGVIPGCIDPTACNFDSLANEDDGSCDLGDIYIPIDIAAGSTPMILSCVPVPGYYFADQACAQARIDNDSYCIEVDYDGLCDIDYQACALNEICFDADEVTCGVPVQGNTEGALNDVQPFCGTGDGSGGGLWYTFDAPTDGEYKITTCAEFTNYDTKVRVYSGSCDALVCVNGDDDESTDPLCDHSGLHSMALVNLIAGEEYFILAHGWSDSEGSFELLATLAEPFEADCPGYEEYDCDADTHPDAIGYPTITEFGCAIDIQFEFEDVLNCDNGEQYYTRHWIITDLISEYVVECDQFFGVIGDGAFTSPTPDMTLDCNDPIPTDLPTTNNCLGTVTYTDYPDMTPWRITGTTGEVDLGSLPSSITLTSGDEGFAGRITTVTTAKAATISFDWHYITNDGPLYDRFRYKINNDPNVVVTDNGGANEQEGHLDVAINSGDNFRLIARTTDGIAGSATIEITNLTIVYDDLVCPVVDCFIRQYLADDLCEDKTVARNQLFNIEDNTAPVLVPTATPVVQHECTAYDVITLGSYALGTLSPADSATYANYVLGLYLADLAPISNTDDCGDATIVFDHLVIEFPENEFYDGGTLTEADCPLRARFTLHYYSTDGCNDTEMYTVTIEGIDTEAPVITLFPDDITIECSLLDDQTEAGVLAYLIAAYDASDVDYEDNCIPFDLFTLEQQAAAGFISVEITSNFDQDCPIVGSCSKTLTVSDGCNEVSQTFTVTLIDTEAPVFADFDENVMVECLEDVPAILDLTAEDCGITIDATSFGSNTGEIVSSCELTDAVGGFATWSLWLPILDEDGLTSSANFVWDADGGLFECYADGTARLTGTVVNDANMAESFDLDFWFENRADWTTWSALGRAYKDDLDCAEPTMLYEAWDYYEMVGGISHAIGQGDLAGSTLSFYHDPASFYFGFQVGDGANNKNCNEGMSGWFTYTGLVNGEQVTGNGDLNVDAQCEEVNESDCVNHTEFKYIYRAVDDCGNAAWACQTIIVDDVTPPTFTTFPADENISCENWPLPIGDVVAEDNCIGDVDLVMVQDSTAGNCPHSFVITRAWRATDLCDNFADSTQTITVTDTTAPIMAGLPLYEVEVECDAIPDTAVVTATDNCSLPENIVIDFIETSTIDVDGSCDYYITRSWIAEDECENFSETFVQTIHVTDAQAPIFDAYDVQVDVECDELIDFTITAQDNCNGATVTYTEVLGSGGCSFGVYTRIYTAVDACGNSAQATQYITVVDTTPPTFTVFPDDAEYQCIDEVPVAASPEGEDNCDDDPVIVYVGQTDDGVTCPLTISRTWTITDDCDNVTTMIQTIVVDDTIAPELEIFTYTFDDSLDLTRSCEDETPAISDYDVSDNCDNDVTVTVTDVDGGDECERTITRTYTATDDCLNETVVVQVITFIDGTSPTFIDVPAAIVIECSEVIPATEASAEDNCDDDVMITASDYEDVAPWCASSTGGNGATIITDSPTVIVLTSSDNFNEESDQYFEYATTAAKAATLTFDWIYTTTDGPSFDILSYSINGVEFPLLDDSGDTDQDGSIEIELAAGDEILFSMESVDDCCDNGVGTISNINFDFDDIECPTVSCVIRQFVAEDNCGNISCAHQLITIEDTTPPVFNPLPIDIDMPCDDISTEIDATATDTCDDDVTITLSDTEFSGGCNGTFVRTYTATDDCGNEVEIEQIIHVIDDVAPVFTDFPMDAEYQCMDDVPTAVMPIGDDNCDDNPVVEFVGETAVGACPTIVTRTWMISDNCMNEHEMSQTITINDTMNPVFGNFPADAELECGDALPTDEPTASDNCSDPSISSEDIESGDSCVMIITRRWTATDDCGNTTTEDQTITISDTTAPEFTFIPASMDVDCDDAIPMDMATAEDSCDNGATISHEDVIDGVNPNCYVLTRTWTVIDDCNNSMTSTMTTVYTVMDNEAPEFDQTVADVNVQCPDPVPAFDVVTATDNCDDAVDVVMTSEVVFEDDCGNITIEVTYNVIDDCGNAAESMTYTITVLDTTAPVIDGDPQDVEITCTDDIPDPIDGITATDNCDADVTVIMIEEVIGHGPTPGSISDCALSTPIESEFPNDWSLWFQAFPGDDLYYTTVNAYFVEFPGGVAHLIGNVESSATGGGWEIDITFQDGMNWTDWEALGRSYKNEYGLVGDNYLDWTYYIMTAGSATLTGTGDYAGSLLNLTHAPSAFYYGYQVGVAANGANDTFGNGGWFYFEGDLVTNGGTPVTVDGAGDLAFDADCCLQYEIERTYTATDCSGNSSSVSYNVIVGEGAINIPGCTDAEACNYDANATNDDDSCDFGDWYLPEAGTNGPIVRECSAPAGYFFANQDCAQEVVDNDPFCVNEDWDFICQGDYDDCLGLVFGCIDAEACNYDEDANTNDDSCQFETDECDDSDDNTENDMLDADCNCVGTPVVIETPENDDCDGAIALEAGTTVVDNTGATAGDLAVECWFGTDGEDNSVWYTFTTPAGDAEVTIETTLIDGSAFDDTQFAVYTSCGGDEIGCDDDSGTDVLSLIVFACGELAPSTTYYLMVDGFSGSDEGVVNLTITYDENACANPGCDDLEACNYDAAATSNDDSCVYAEGCDTCSGETDGTGVVIDNPEEGELCDDGDMTTDNDAINADCECEGTPIVIAPVNDECDGALAYADGIIDNTGATAGDLTGFWTDGEDNSIWFTFTTPTEDAEITIETSAVDGSDFNDTQLAVFGSCVETTAIAANDDGGDGLYSLLTLACGDLAPNTTYYLLVDGWNAGDVGECNITMTVNTDACTNPGCDDLEACNYDDAVTSNDDSCVYADGCDTCSGETDGTGVVIDNPEEGELCDDGDMTTDNDAINADCECEGTPIVIAPANDECADAEAIACGDVVDGNTATATADEGIADCGTSLSSAPGVWFTIDGDGSEITASLCGSGYDTKIGVFEGTCEVMTCVEGNDDSCSLQSEATFVSEVDMTYYIYVTGFSTAAGEFTLAVTCEVAPDCPVLGLNIGDTCNDGDGTTNSDTVTADCDCVGTPAAIPANDLCSDAIMIECGDDIDGYTNLATTDGAPTDFCGTTPGAAGVWYTIIGTGSMTDFSLCNVGTNYDTKINVYSGDCGTLTCVDGNDDGVTGCGLSSFVSTFLDDGVTYYVYVNGFGGNVGEFTLSVTCNDPEPFIIVDLEVILEGPLQNIDNFEMLDHIRTEESFPLTEPYTELGYERGTDGGETTTEEILEVSGESAVVDWILVELRDGDNPEVTIESRAALLLKNGKIVSAHNGLSALYFTEPGVDYNSVVVVIKHRNHLGTCNSVPFQLTGFTENLTLDFTDPTLEVVGDELGMGVVNGVRVMYAGDANHDGSVNPYDKNAHWRVENGGVYDYFYSKSDFNLDGAINPFDKNTIWRVNNGRSEQIGN